LNLEKEKVYKIILKILVQYLHSSVKQEVFLLHNPRVKGKKGKQ
jgi:hypothetical protein